jgi:hypothetical protein
MHQHECNKHKAKDLIWKNKYCFIFFCTIFPVKKINVGKNFKIKGNRCLNFSSYSHPEIWEFHGVTSSLADLVRPYFDLNFSVQTTLQNVM